MGGFNPDQVMGMDAKAAEGFGADQVRNLLPESKNAVGDKIETFENVGIDVRQELVAQPQRRLGGVGSFQDLVKSMQAGDGASASTSQANPPISGWDLAQLETPSFDQVQVNGGSGEALGGSEVVTFFSKLAMFGVSVPTAEEVEAVTTP
jgi:hypothetical protein